jgi:SAM-dependent methyltransferase
MPNTSVSAGFGPDSHLNLDISLFLSDSTSARRHQFGVMFFPDKLQGYKEARRVLRPGGHFFFNVWDRISENEFADVVTPRVARAR